MSNLKRKNIMLIMTHSINHYENNLLYEFNDQSKNHKIKGVYAILIHDYYQIQ